MSYFIYARKSRKDAELEEALLEWLKDYIVKYEFTDTHEEDAAAIAAKA